MKMTYVPKKFSAPTELLLTQANQIIQDYQSQGYILTLRQLYYRFVAQALIPNTQRSYKKLGSVINAGRLAGEVDWHAIEDRGRNVNKIQSWDNPGEIIQTAAASYAIDTWENQDTRVEVWIEKQALESVIMAAAEALDCPSFACKGYTSQSEMWRASRRFAAYEASGQNTVIIHLGDHDPSGIDMTRDIQDRLMMFEVDTIVERIALNMDQIQKHNPPPNPAKITDTRAKHYIAKFGQSSWELDALDPKELRQLITSAIEKHLDRAKMNEKIEQQEEERQKLTYIAENWETL